MLTSDNYYGQINRINLRTLPPALVKGHEYVEKVSNGGSDWNPYYSSETIKKVVDMYFSKVEPYIESSIPEDSNTPEIIPINKKAKKQRAEKLKAVKTPKPEKQPKEFIHPGNPVERVSESVKFCKRYAALNGKTKTKEEILSFINALQRSILEHRIRKTDEHHAEIMHIQKELVKCYNQMGKTIAIKIEKDTLAKYLEIGDDEYQMKSIALLKRYVGLHGKKGVKEQAERLLKTVENALHSGHISKSDRYYDRVMDMKRRLDLYIKGSSEVMLIEETELSGLNGLGFLPTVVAAVTGALSAKMTENLLARNKGLSGVMTSENLASKHFQTLGLKNPWLSLIGDPSPGFNMLLYGAPKSGKSTLALAFGKYLAQNHGKTLYWSNEEGFGYTMQEKIKRLGAEHPNLFISEELPVNLSAYKFVIIDSITKAGMDHRDMAALKHSNPGVSFIFIAQSTKDGSYRGARDLEHEVDVIVKVENGVATSFGRFNQGGSLKIPFKT